MKPIIGVTGNFIEADRNFALRDYYIDSVSRAGGIPIILPPCESELYIKRYVDLCNGILISGGGDIDPVYWGEIPVKELGEITPIRDVFEIKMAQYCMMKNIPTLGICRGCQVLNTASGGSIVQDIKTNMCHTQKAPRNYAFHDIFIKKDTILYNILKSERIRVNSFHHQAVNQLGNKMVVTAYSPDRTIEAIESTKHRYFIGVQWHPECLTDEYSALLFKSLVDFSS
ncbi:Glutamine amidotransferase, class I [Candidatus Syntrophocurvum alkaliphilum]|uniref:Glutamine amidotransferase, class I n=1 Tax=Candidatus Syntrophocurvum alkaliphilum TaxID=2293317 RepID=A0A6I6DB74_9FIRM|nr:gamma-glutamyl-gamma-aminobutyrate hydrolase family protein [Candidatus Syntrophocurvum alkaliphilum]QGT98744.1 Glutamine amidotransferase, class I [Candidatus Syntrophocurvum alkaliphilum]